jgi:magnesium-transporting ATPase (P-type)
MSVNAPENAYRQAAHFALQGVAGAYLGVFLSVTSADIALETFSDISLYLFICCYPLISLFVMSILPHPYTSKTTQNVSIAIFVIYTIVFSLSCLAFFFNGSSTLSEEFTNNIAGNLTIVGIFLLWFTFIMIFEDADKPDSHAKGGS